MVLRKLYSSSRARGRTGRRNGRLADKRAACGRVRVLTDMLARMRTSGRSNSEMKRNGDSRLLLMKTALNTQLWGGEVDDGRKHCMPGGKECLFTIRNGGRRARVMRR